MSQFFITPYNQIDFVEVHDDTFSLHENGKRMMILPKSALSAMITSYDNILLDLEEHYEMGMKYFAEEDTIIFTKTVLENDGRSGDGGHAKVVCIQQAPIEIVLRKEDFQLMLIIAAITCRIEADHTYRQPHFPEYELTSSKSMVFPDNQTFTIVDESRQIQFDMPMSALATMVMCKDQIVRDLRDDDSFGEWVYWSDNTSEIKSRYVQNFRVLSFSLDNENYVDCISIRDQTFEKMIYIAVGGPSWIEDMGDRMREIRDLYWDSIPINTVKRIQFSRDGRLFTLINEVNGETLTLPVEALQAAQRYKRQILQDLEDNRFQPTYGNDYIKQYWTDNVYAIRTGVFYNLYRNIDCNVVRFTRVKDNYFHFVLRKEAFLWLLDQ